MESSSRDASHAGSWYPSNPQTLAAQLGEYLSKASKHQHSNNLKSIIVPHAGYTYCGPTAAHAFININPDNFDNVVILGPSHHAYFKGCGLTKFTTFSTPFGPITIDTQSNVKLISSPNKHFNYITGDIDEEEHSIEMELPFLKLIFNKKDFRLLPIMIGDINLSDAREIASALMEMYEDPKTLFVISSDFCHWGKRFGFTYYDKSKGNIWESTENLDKIALEIIGKLDVVEFDGYFEKYKNTICGKKPISIVLCAIEEYKKKKSGNGNDDGKKILFECVNYSQSEKVMNMGGSSVSYAAGVNFII